MYRYNKKYSLAYVFAHMPDLQVSRPETFVEIDGDSIMMVSTRYNLLKHHPVCQKCKLKGLYFYKEKQELHHPYHLNLYGINADGNEVLLSREKSPSNCKLIRCADCIEKKKLSRTRTKRVEELRAKRRKLSKDVWIMTTESAEGKIIEIDLYTEAWCGNREAKWRGFDYVSNGLYYNKENNLWIRIKQQTLHALANHKPKEN